MDDKPIESWRARAAVSEALDVFNSVYMQEIWAKALARRDTEPEGAVTSARTLLESVCKHILELSDVDVNERWPLPRLYKETATVLEIAPSEDLAPAFDRIFAACAEVIEGIGQLRNQLSDSHGRGPFGDMPDWRHAELAVNLSGAMATYLAAVWRGKQAKVATVLREYINAPRGNMNRTMQYTLEAIAESSLGALVAANVRATDLVTYFEDRAARGAHRGRVPTIKPTTLRREFATLKVALDRYAREEIAEASRILRQRKMLSEGTHVTPIRRLSQGDFAEILRYLREKSGVWRDRKHHGTAAGLADLVEFTAWSGRAPNETLALRWADVDFDKHTCKLAGKKDSFPLLEKAWTIIQERRSSQAHPSGRIFPYEWTTAESRHQLAIRSLMAEGKIQWRIRFIDYRHEAAYRLLERQYPEHIVVRATGLSPRRIHDIAKNLNTHTVSARGIAEPKLA